MNGEKAREVTIDCSFLGEGSFTSQILKDGPNADRIGTDYLFETLQIRFLIYIEHSFAGDAVRSPLVLSLSREGVHFDTHYNIGATHFPSKRPGHAKVGEYGYPESVVHAGSLYV